MRNQSGDIRMTDSMKNPLMEDDIRKGEAALRRQVKSSDIAVTTAVNTKSNGRNASVETRGSSRSDDSIKEGFFWATLDTNWTVLDQKRLVSMDYLYHRSLEFHNNHHTFRATGADYDYTKQLDPMGDGSLACIIRRCDIGTTRATPEIVSAAELDKVLMNPLPERYMIQGYTSQK
jgi:hypothetical protein